MRVEFQIVHVEHLADTVGTIAGSGNNGQSFQILNGRFEYRELVPNAPLNPDSSCLLGDGSATTQLRKIWADTNREGLIIPSGEIKLTNFIVFGNQNLLLSQQDSVCLVGGVVNWGVEYAREFITNHFSSTVGFEWTRPGECFVVDIPTGLPKISRAGVLMGSPGYEIYGHWLLDYGPRLLLTKLMFLGPEEWYLFPHLRSWAMEFLSAFGVKREICGFDNDAGFRQYEFCRMPSGAKNGFRLASPTNKLAWIWLRDVFRMQPFPIRELGAIRPSDKIYVSRKSWGSSRTISNADHLEQIATKRGYTIIHPEKFSVTAQAKIFQQARIILGEDGSGLHNIIFSDPGCVLGVVGTHDRINLWHMGICQQLGHKLAYELSSLDREGHRKIDEDKFHSMIDLLESESAL